MAPVKGWDLLLLGNKQSVVEVDVLEAGKIRIKFSWLDAVVSTY